MGYRRVVVGTDGSGTADEAVRHAARLAGSAGAELVIVMAYGTEGAGLADEGAEAPSDLQWAVTGSGDAEDHLVAARHVAAESGAGKVRSRAVAGDPADVLVGVAEELLADVIVVGNRGMAGTTRFLLGSVPNKVSHHAPCDVLIVRTA